MSVQNKQLGSSRYAEMLKHSEDAKKRRRKRHWLPLAIAGAIILSLAAAVFFLEGEAMTANDILNKQNWSDKELQNALTRSMVTKDPEGNREVIEHLDRQLRKLPAARQDKIRKEVVVDASRKALKQLRKMPRQERQKLISALTEKAEANYSKIQNDSSIRKEAAMRANSREFEIFANEVNRVMLSELRPDERVQLAPLTKVWIRTMKTVGR